MPKDYVDAPAVEEVAKKLLPTFHSELAEAQIKYYFVTEHSMKAGRPISGKAKKLSGAGQYLAGGFNFTIEVAMDLWNIMEPAERKATVDHLLEYCTSETDDEGDTKYSMREPDVKEFSTILSRHGAYNELLRGFIQVAKTINIEERMQEIINENSGDEDEQAQERN